MAPACFRSSVTTIFTQFNLVSLDIIDVAVALQTTFADLDRPGNIEILPAIFFQNTFPGFQLFVCFLLGNDGKFVLVSFVVGRG